MNKSAIEVTNRAGALWAILNRPEKMNPLDAQALTEMEEIFERARRENPVALIITGRGPAFCAGADLKWVKRVAEEGITPEFTRHLGGARRMMQTVEELPFPVIAGVNGICVAGGMELVCACDLVVAAESAQFADGHANFGLVPLAGTAHRLAARVGLSNAKRLLFTGEFISASEAHRMGLANWVVPNDKLEATLEQLCGTLEAKAPVVLEHMKNIANHGALVPPSTAAYIEFQVGCGHLYSDVVKEGLRAFAEKRPPKFR